MAEMMRLTLASFETIARRTAMMASGTCSPAEYRKMVAEKVTASQRSFFALATGRGQKAVIAPYQKAATANAKRLRKR